MSPARAPLKKWDCGGVYGSVKPIHCIASSHNMHLAIYRIQDIYISRQWEKRSVICQIIRDNLNGLIPQVIFYHILWSETYILPRVWTTSWCKLKTQPLPFTWLWVAVNNSYGNLRNSLFFPVTRRYSGKHCCLTANVFKSPWGPGSILRWVCMCSSCLHGVPSGFPLGFLADQKDAI